MYPSTGNHPMHGDHNPSQPAVNIYSATNINISPPVSLQRQQQGHRSKWTTGLCGCGEDCCNCCLTFWCPCITFGQIAEIADSGSTSCGLSGALYCLLLYFTGCACYYSCCYRKKLRAKFNLEENPCGDCLVHFCCESCALCQEYRELKNRGFDPSLGWQGNRGRQGQSAFPAGIATAPPMGQAMYS